MNTSGALTQSTSFSPGTRGTPTNVTNPSGNNFASSAYATSGQQQGRIVRPTKTPIVHRKGPGKPFELR